MVSCIQKVQSNIFLFIFIETYFLLVKTCLHWLSQKGQIERKAQRSRLMFLFRKKQKLKCFFSLFINPSNVGKPRLLENYRSLENLTLHQNLNFLAIILKNEQEKGEGGEGLEGWQPVRYMGIKINECEVYTISELKRGLITGRTHKSSQCLQRSTGKLPNGPVSRKMLYNTEKVLR